METTIDVSPEHQSLSPAGCRRASPAYRQSLQQSQDFTGLEEDANRFELLHLVKRAGKAAGFTLRMVELLEYYVVHTQDQDWRRGGRPIVYQSLARVALALGVSERQIQKLENRLFEVGALTWNASGNNKRYGSRCPETGTILFAYGVDLTPLAFLQAELKIKLYEKQTYDRQWIATRREISALRGRLRSLIEELREEGRDTALSAETQYQKIAYQLRTHINLAEMHQLLERHKKLQEELLQLVEVYSPMPAECAQHASIAQETANGSPRSDHKFAHYKYANLLKNRCSSPADEALQESVAEPPAPDDEQPPRGDHSISLRRLLSVASERFRQQLPRGPRAMHWPDAVEAASRLRPELFISQRSWADACQTLGREGAAICLLVTDRAQNRPSNPVRNPAAYFRGMVNKARGGELHLARSIFGLLEIADSAAPRTSS